MRKALTILLCVAAIFPAGCGRKTETKGNQTITIVTKLQDGTNVTTVTTPQGRVLSITSDGPI